MFGRSCFGDLYLVLCSIILIFYFEWFDVLIGNDGVEIGYESRLVVVGCELYLWVVG